MDSFRSFGHYSAARMLAPAPSEIAWIGLGAGCLMVVPPRSRVTAPQLLFSILKGAQVNCQYLWIKIFYHLGDEIPRPGTPVAVSACVRYK
jgi:hypothetical protein